MAQQESSTDSLTTFTVLRTDAPITAERVLDAVRRAATTSHVPGFGSARLYLTDDRDTVVVLGQWASAEAYAAALADHPGIAGWQDAAELPGVHVGTSSACRAVPGLDGPAAGEPEGVTVVAIRHLTPGAADNVLELLERSGGWKRSFPGFIAATPYVSADGTVFVNHARWADEEAYRAWMGDPRISEGQEEIAAHETAPAEYLRCAFVAHVEPAGRPGPGQLRPRPDVRALVPRLHQVRAGGADARGCRGVVPALPGQPGRAGRG